MVPDELGSVGEHSLHLPLSSFVNQMEAVARTHRVVPLSEALDWDRPRAGRPSLAITFDDAYSGAIELAGGVLARMGLPATMFVAPGVLGGHAFWWDRYSPDDPGWLPDAFREAVLSQGVAGTDRVEALAHHHGVEAKVIPDYARSASVDAVRSYAQIPGFTLAPHSWSHPNLTALTAEAQRDEFERSLRWVNENGPSSGPWISYPFGLATAETEDIARQAGLTAGFGLGGDWIPKRPANDFHVSRVNVHAQLDQTTFRLRVDGLPRGTGA
ncbi:MAG: polysaccharide deacetylase family protein [Longimicrobiales bacterium]